MRTNLSQVNICLPDSSKSCAACCGLYSVTDGSRFTLEEKLARRTEIFRHTDRAPDALDEYRNSILRSEAAAPLDDVIHVCEFTGFLDSGNALVGCMLHPYSQGNANVDLRGMCHYGSMACKTFYCPAWQELSPSVKQAVVEAIDDWHLYGLVITDVDFLLSVFDFLEHNAQETVFPLRVLSESPLPVFQEILSWKCEWPFAGNSRTRKSRYYIKGSSTTTDVGDNVQRILECLNFGYASCVDSPAARDFIEDALQRLAAACNDSL